MKQAGLCESLIEQIAKIPTIEWKFQVSSEVFSQLKEINLDLLDYSV